MTEDLRVIEICAGAGGQALGLEQAGFEHELAVELDENAVNTLRHNRPHWKIARGDVADATVWNPEAYTPAPDRRPIDLLAGGVPCPPFSIAGKQLGASDERDLFAWAVEQANVVKPRALLLENVRGLSMPRFAGYRQHVLDRLGEFGYSAEWRLLNASDYGVPQLRPRFVLIAMKPDDFAHFHWPVPTTNVPTVGETLLPLMARNGWRGAEAWAERANDIAPTIVGGSKKHGGADLGPTRAKRAWAQLGVDALGVANEAPDVDDIFSVGPKLTCEMVSRIQGWDDKDFKWEFTGRKTSNYRQIGNAFPPPVAKALGLAIVAALNGTAQRRDRDPAPDMDPIYRTLRGNSGFMTSSQIMRATGLDLTAPEIDRRISLLSRDFEIIKETRKSGLAYQLGEFKAFTGQDNHLRHDYLRSNVSKVS
ncbi:DNA cytosine methyltransferase [Rhodococcus opacus]|uniref:DNA cytosine methyltransferase n=1 Tax=Rhodococcus opacus TaxID=37919 RepID=UPI0024BA1655|nr:DNA (cytosine-5-)-methyltransferase [Rhodococcus opacus]MDJ0412826.1 DNA (cytosine-5-)-methyltransferase [Rhodococcus opacus]